MSQVESAGEGNLEELPLTPNQMLLELVMMGLRTTEGIPRHRLDALREAEDYAPLMNRIAMAQERGWVVFDESKLLSTQDGRWILDSLLEYLFK